ncbi:MAG: hypothetical protein GF329_14065 [Candidatus Lokiarchaeota archaeon]|nr:hypothetical protein [Candidatus Lokiarchaeota archaeon]
MNELEKDIKFWIIKGLAISGGVIAVITLFLPWYQISGSYLINITPIFINYNGIFLFFWDYYKAMGIDFGFIPILVMMDASLILIVLSLLLNIFTLSRKPSSMIMIIIVVSFVIISIAVIMMGITPFNFIDFPFFGSSGGILWGFSIGWMLLFLALFLTLFPRKLILTEKEKFKNQIKQKIEELQD